MGLPKAGASHMNKCLAVLHFTTSAEGCSYTRKRRLRRRWRLRQPPSASGSGRCSEILSASEYGSPLSSARGRALVKGGIKHLTRGVELAMTRSSGGTAEDQKNSSHPRNHAGRIGFKFLDIETRDHVILHDDPASDQQIADAGGASASDRGN